MATKTDILEFKLDSLNKFITPTTTDKRQFETNCRNEFMCNILGHNMKTINKHKSLIGQKAYKFKKSLLYTDLESYNNDKNINKSINPLEEEPIELTIEKYNEFLKSYIEYQIQYQTEYLVSSSITCNSTHKLTNLEFEWMLDSRQELIKIYKAALEAK